MNERKYCVCGGFVRKVQQLCDRLKGKETREREMDLKVKQAGWPVSRLGHPDSAN